MIPRNILEDLEREHERADKLHGENPDYPDGNHLMAMYWEGISESVHLHNEERRKEGIIRFMDVLYEEVAEAFAETKPTNLRKELIEVANVAIRWVAAIDRRKRK